jgi:hypothetical protein
MQVRDYAEKHNNPDDKAGAWIWVPGVPHPIPITYVLTWHGMVNPTAPCACLDCAYPLSPSALSDLKENDGKLDCYV